MSSCVTTMVQSWKGRFQSFFFFFAGLGPPLDSKVFHTGLPGRPGSPSHVTATWLSGEKAALVCWEPSEVGKPFVSYTIEVLEVKMNVTKIWKIAANIVKENLPNCTAGYTVSVYNCRYMYMKVQKAHLPKPIPT